VPRRSRQLLRGSRLGVLMVSSLLWALGAARAQEPLFAGSGPSVAAILRALREEKVLSARPVGTTSAVFKLDLAGPIDAAFRPQSRYNPRGVSAELAAFRLARRLGLDNVAPVVPRSFPVSALLRLVGAAYPDAWEALEKELIPRHGQVLGAAVYWIPELRELGLDTPPGVARFTRWLAQGAELPAQPELAAQVSTMLAFDYLIANCDRFSGANAQGDAGAKRLFLRDHNLAFLDPFRASQHRRALARLKRTQRFSRRFVAALKALPEDGLSGVLADPLDPPELQVVSQGQVQGIMERRRALLSYVAALIDSYGESNVLTFP
jgi:hypothetical protein